MRRYTHHRWARNFKRKSGKSRLGWRIKKFFDIFYQLLLPLIMFQFIRTLFLPTAFDVLLLMILVFLYIMYWIN